VSVKHDLQFQTLGTGAPAAARSFAGVTAPVLGALAVLPLIKKNRSVKPLPRKKNTSGICPEVLCVRNGYFVTFTVIETDLLLPSFALIVILAVPVFVPEMICSSIPSV